MKAILSYELLDTFLDKGVEALCFDYPIDEHMTNHAPKFAGKTSQAITNAGFKLEDEDVDMVNRRETICKD